MPVPIADCYPCTMIGCLQPNTTSALSSTTNNVPLEGRDKNPGNALSKGEMMMKMWKRNQETRNWPVIADEHNPPNSPIAHLPPVASNMDDENDTSSITNKNNNDSQAGVQQGQRLTFIGEQQQNF